jgi:hypothetical protein
MSTQHKRVEDLSSADLTKFPVWEFLNQDQKGETAVRPVKAIPVRNLIGRLVGTQVRLANGSKVLALIGNVTVNNPRSTRHFLTISFFQPGKRFTLARYHDFDWNERGPSDLANFLGARVEDIFPISYDLSQFATGDPAALVGAIDAEPRERLTRAEIIALAIAKFSA